MGMNVYVVVIVEKQIDRNITHEDVHFALTRGRSKTHSMMTMTRLLRQSGDR